MTLRDIGLAAHDGDDAELADLGLTGTDDPVVTLGRLGRADIERRRFITTAAYSVAAAAMPLGLADEYAERTAAATSGRRAGAADVQAVHDMVRMFVAIDERHGGRHGRSTVVQYLTTDVAEMCRAVFHTGEQHRRMLSTAASLAHLAGWKAYDAGEHGLAQRYYLQAYRLTREAENEPHQAYVMRILAHHGMDNGRPEHTLALAEAALSRAHGKVESGHRVPVRHLPGPRPGRGGQACGRAVRGRPGPGYGRPRRRRRGGRLGGDVGTPIGDGRLPHCEDHEVDRGPRGSGTTPRRRPPAVRQRQPPAYLGTVGGRRRRSAVRSGTGRTRV